VTIRYGEIEQDPQGREVQPGHPGNLLGVRLMGTVAVFLHMLVVLPVAADGLLVPGVAVRVDAHAVFRQVRRAHVVADPGHRLRQAGEIARGVIPAEVAVLGVIVRPEFACRSPARRRCRPSDPQNGSGPATWHRRTGGRSHRPPCERPVFPGSSPGFPSCPARSTCPRTRWRGDCTSSESVSAIWLWMFSK
jgi:hypothetical protein